jgi:hypothetical protein
MVIVTTKGKSVCVTLKLITGRNKGTVPKERPFVDGE